MINYVLKKDNFHVSNQFGSCLFMDSLTFYPTYYKISLQTIFTKNLEKKNSAYTWISPKGRIRLIKIQPCSYTLSNFVLKVIYFLFLFYFFLFLHWALPFITRNLKHGSKTCQSRFHLQKFLTRISSITGVNPLITKISQSRPRSRHPGAGLEWVWS